MNLDVHTLLVINAANLLLMAFTLPFIMGRQLSAAAASARTSLMVQALGWVAMMVSSLWALQWLDLLLSTLSIVCFSVGQWLMFQALQGWLGRRPGQTLLAVAAVLTPVGYALAFGSYPLRVGWVNLMLALQLLIVCLATLRPLSQLGGAWRWVVFGCTLTMVLFTAARGVMGAFFTELYPSFQAPHPVNVLAMLAANFTLVLGTLAILVAWREEAEAQLRTQAHTDCLTGLLNRRGWEDCASMMVEQARRHGDPLALIVLDLDHFKHINDTQGHEGGDQVLKMLGAVLRQCRRGSDLAARLGGEEFALLLPRTERAAALLFEQRLRQALQEASRHQPVLAVKYSAGLALFEAAHDTLTTLMMRADGALYQAKQQGRGRLVVADGLAIGQKRA